MNKHNLLILAAFGVFSLISSAHSAEIADSVSRASVERGKILTPPTPSTPRINGARVVGARPGNPFLFYVPVTGDRQMKVTASDLPKGLSLNPDTGIIKGITPPAGTYKVTLTASNAHGSATRELRIVAGEMLALTPPLGWNSWNCFARTVSADKVKAAADAMVKSGLINHGWTYINIDDFWQKSRDSDDPTLGGPGRDSEGRIVPNPRFPDMKALADYVHASGLKLGIYSSPGPFTCGGCLGSFDHEQQDTQSYAAWGIDYLKYDWCSYKPEMEKLRGTTPDFSGIEKFWGNYGNPSRNELMRPYALMGSALDKGGRDIVYGLCQYGMGNVWEWGAQVGGNCWRVSGDIRDSWKSMSSIGFGQAGRESFVKPGNWNDLDMLVVGKVGWGKNLHSTRLTPDEQYTHITLWCLLSSPLLIGCDMTQLDDFTLSLLENDEVLEVDQDPLGSAASRITKNGATEVWAKEMSDGSYAVGLFNRGSESVQVSIAWADLKLKGPQRIRDLWRQQDIGTKADGYSAEITPHGCMLIRVSSVE